MTLPAKVETWDACYYSARANAPTTAYSCTQESHVAGIVPCYLGRSVSAYDMGLLRVQELPIMLYANTPQGDKITATPSAEGKCPLCSADLIPKCGRVNAWHWAHKTVEDCDLWFEPETAWHLGWKRIMQPLWCEFSFGKHRADIIGNGLTVIELQHSPISPNEIEEREAFYHKMIWLFDATDVHDRFETCHKYGTHGPYVSFRWKHARRSIAFCRCPVFLDLGGYIFEVKKIYSNPVAGWGHALTLKQFTDRFLSEFRKLPR